MSRASITGESIVVAVDEDLLVWTDGLLSCRNRELKRAAEFASETEQIVDLSVNGPAVPASLYRTSSPERALAALLAAGNGRGRVLEAPASILALLDLPLDDEGLKQVYGAQMEDGFEDGGRVADDDE